MRYSNQQFGNDASEERFMPGQILQNMIDDGLSDPNRSPRTAYDNHGGRAKLPPPAPLTRDERNAVVERQLFDDMMRKAERIQDSDLFQQLDRLDQEALKMWYKQASSAGASKKEKRDTRKNVKKVVDLYKLYGSE